MKKKDVILQARSTSTRLPEKIFKLLNNKTMLEQIIIRLKKIKNIDDICIATIKQDYEKIKELIKPYNIKVIYGDEENVLSRFIKAGEYLGSDIIIRTTADNPFVDYENLEKAVNIFLENDYDYLVFEGLPYGAGFEVINFEALRKAYNNAKNNYDKEHVTPYIYNNPDMFNIKKIKPDKDYFCPELRVTVDTEEDYKKAVIWYKKYFNKNINTVNLKELIKNECSK